MIVAKSLEGDYRPEHLFALRQSLLDIVSIRGSLRSRPGTRTEMRVSSANGAPSRCRREPRCVFINGQATSRHLI